jgi:uncharacterized protein
MKIGVVSDTHGLLRPEVAPALEGVDRILHLGDVGDAKILAALGKIATVTAIRGNIDRDGPCSRLPETEVLLVPDSQGGGRYIYMLHDLNELHLDPAAAKFSAVLSGHTHKPRIEWRKGVLYFNPGSCGPKRFDLRITLGLLEINDGQLQPRLIDLL